MMNKRIIPIVVGLLIIANIIFILRIDGALDPNHGILRGGRTCEDCHGNHGEKVSIVPKELKTNKIQLNNSTESHYNSTESYYPVYSYAFWFNNSNCNENNTKTNYESKKVDGSWQIITVMTCLNDTVRIIPV